MAGEINPYTGSYTIWDEPEVAPTQQAQLAEHIEQRFRNRHQFLANHHGLNEAAGRLASTLDLSKGEAGLDTFLDAVAADLEKPENNGLDGMLGEIVAEQRRMGLIE